MSVLFPIVPIVAGIPPVRRAINSALPTLNTISLLIADARLLFGHTPPQWGILGVNGQPAITPDSFIEFGVRHDWRLADYPIENGGYGSYDRVDTPPLVRIQVTKGGDNLKRLAFLKQLSTLVTQPTGLFKLRCPEANFTGYWSITHYDYERRQHGGVTLLTVDIWFQQVNIVQVNGSNPVQIYDKDPVNVGTVQPSFGILSSGLDFLGGAVNSVLDTVNDLLPSLSSIGGAIGSIGSTIGAMAGNLGDAATDILGSTVGSAGSLLLNTGYSMGAMGSQLFQATSLVSGLAPTVTAGLLPQLAGATQSAMAVSDQLISSSSVLSGGGSLSTYLFGQSPLASLPSAIPGSSALGQALDNNSGSFTVNGITFGPVYPGKVQ